VVLGFVSDTDDPVGGRRVSVRYLELESASLISKYSNGITF
jgi:hypothetical protein